MAVNKTINELQTEYVRWVQETCNCSACKIEVPRLTDFLVNKNIKPIMTSQPVDSIPQVGYLGEEYLRYRVLVLGKNPAWPKNLVDDKLYYTYIQGIQNIPALQKNTPELRAMHNRWTPLKASELDLVGQVGLESNEIAYANQILCRTDTNKIDPNKLDAQRGAVSGIQKNTVNQIYNSCYKNRISRLIEILDPQHILAIGKLNDKEFSWPHILENLLQSNATTRNIRVWHVRFPTGQGGLINESRRDTIGLRKALGILK